MRTLLEARSSSARLLRRPAARTRGRRVLAHDALTRVTRAYGRRRGRPRRGAGPASRTRRCCLTPLPPGAAVEGSVTVAAGRLEIGDLRGAEVVPPVSGTVSRRPPSPSSSSGLAAGGAPRRGAWPSRACVPARRSSPRSASWRAPAPVRREWPGCDCRSSEITPSPARTVTSWATSRTSRSPRAGDGPSPTSAPDHEVLDAHLHPT